VLKKKILSTLHELEKLSPKDLLDKRYDKFRAMGVFAEGTPPYAPEAEPPKEETGAEEQPKDEKPAKD